MVAFGSVSDVAAGRRWHAVPMHHVVDFHRSYLRQHWEVLRHAQIKDSTLGLLALLEKCGLDHSQPIESGLSAEPRNTEPLHRSRRSTT